jgi:hypothetical protein
VRLFPAGWLGTGGLLRCLIPDQKHVRRRNLPVGARTTAGFIRYIRSTALVPSRIVGIGQGEVNADEAQGENDCTNERDGYGASKGQIAGHYFIAWLLTRGFGSFRDQTSYTQTSQI